MAVELLPREHRTVVSMAEAVADGSYPVRAVARTPHLSAVHVVPGPSVEVAIELDEVIYAHVGGSAKPLMLTYAQQAGPFSQSC